MSEAVILRKSKNGCIVDKSCGGGVWMRRNVCGIQVGQDRCQCRALWYAYSDGMHARGAVIVADEVLRPCK